MVSLGTLDTFSLQAVVFDSNAVQGVAFSNAVNLTFN